MYKSDGGRVSGKSTHPLGPETAFLSERGINVMAWASTSLRAFSFFQSMACASTTLCAWPEGCVAMRIVSEVIKQLREASLVYSVTCSWMVKSKVLCEKHIDAV